MKRRRFIQATAGTAALATVRPSLPGAEKGFVDTNAYLGSWPFRGLPSEGAPKLEAALRSAGVTAAWTGSFGALLQRDLDAVNERLAASCAAGSGLFEAVGAVNPMLPGWRETLQRCREDHGMKAIRLHPNYHGYGLGDEEAAALLEEARTRGLLVQIAVRMEDTRTQHPKVAVPDVDVQPLLGSLEKAPGARVQLLNAMRTVRDALLLQRLGKFGVGMEIAMLEGIEGIRNFLDRESGVKLCYGSYAPFFYAEAAALKLEESVLSTAERETLLAGSAKGLLGG